MKKKEIKIIWDLAKNFLIAGVAIWILETVFFLIIQGWHWKATDPIEIFFDNVAGFCLKVGLALTLYSSYYLFVRLNKT